MVGRTALHGLVDLARVIHGPNTFWKSFSATPFADHISCNACPQELRRFQQPYYPQAITKGLASTRTWSQFATSGLALMMSTPFVTYVVPTRFQFGVYRSWPYDPSPRIRAFSTLTCHSRPLLFCLFPRIQGIVYHPYSILSQRWTEILAEGLKCPIERRNDCDIKRDGLQQHPSPSLGRSLDGRAAVLPDPWSRPGLCRRRLARLASVAGYQGRHSRPGPSHDEFSAP